VAFKQSAVSMMITCHSAALISECVCVIMAATCGHYLQQLVAVTVVWCNFFYSLIQEHLESADFCQGGPSPDLDQESGSG